MPLIPTLIDKKDNVEIIRDEIAAILVAEIANQRALAILDSQDPNDFTLRIFLERANPWAEFLDSPDQLDATPIVNIATDSENFDGSASNIVERQKVTAVYNIDCYGYGIAEDDGATGHTPGDEAAGLEAARAMRLVRNILMSAQNTYLNLRGVVWKRWPQSIRYFQPQLEERAVQKIVGARLQFAVDFNEFSPQHVPETLELVSVTVERKETGEVYLLADYPSTP